MTMTRDKIEELKRLAEKATPGEWLYRTDPGNPTGFKHCVKLPGEFGAWVCDCLDNADKSTEGGIAGERNAAFIAAADPKTILSLLALAERALEPQGQACGTCGGSGSTDATMSMNCKDCDGTGSLPQGQALPELPKGWPNSHPYSYTADDMRAYARAYASQLALPAGPVPEGWKLVPLKADENMLKAAYPFHWRFSPGKDAARDYERMVAAAPAFSMNKPRKDNPIAFSCAKRAAHPTSWSMTCDQHCRDDSKCLRHVPADSSAMHDHPQSPPKNIGTFSLSIPDSYGHYWHWSGRDSDKPDLEFVTLDGQQRPVIDRGPGGHGFNHYDHCEVLGGYWARAVPPEIVPSPAVAQPVADERAAADAYFKARHHMLDTTANRNVFSAGFRAALCQPVEEGGKAPGELQAVFRKAVFDQGFAIINRLMKAFTQSEDLRADGDVKDAIHDAMTMAGELTRAARACGYEPPLQTGCSYETWPGCDTQKHTYALQWKKVQPEEVAILNQKPAEEGDKA